MIKIILIKKLKIVEKIIKNKMMIIIIPNKIVKVIKINQIKVNNRILNQQTLIKKIIKFNKKIKKVI